MPPGTGYGCGVTAYGYDDAFLLLKNRVFAGEEVPSIARVTDNVDVSTLDGEHVLPNMDPPIYRGVWFPRGYG